MFIPKGVFMKDNFFKQSFIASLLLLTHFSYAVDADLSIDNPVALNKPISTLEAVDSSDNCSDGLVSNIHAFHSNIGFLDILWKAKYNHQGTGNIYYYLKVNLNNKPVILSSKMMFLPMEKQGIKPTIMTVQDILQLNDVKIISEDDPFFPSLLRLIRNEPRLKYLKDFIDSSRERQAYFLSHFTIASESNFEQVAAKIDAEIPTCVCEFSKLASWTHNEPPHCVMITPQEYLNHDIKNALRTYFAANPYTTLFVKPLPIVRIQKPDVTINQEPGVIMGEIFTDNVISDFQMTSSFHIEWPEDMYSFQHIHVHFRPDTSFFDF